MNKKLLIAAVGAALVAGSAVATAAPTVYGKLNVGIAQVNNGEDSVMGITDDASRLGVKGDEDLGGGLKAIYMWEMTIDGDNGAFGTSSASGGSTAGSRDVYVGLQGGWGSVRVGSFNSAYKNLSTGLEIFGDTVGDFTHTTMTGEPRTANTISYISPNFNGFTLSAERSHSETKNTVPATDVDESNPTVVTLSYSMGPLYVGIGQNSYNDMPYEVKELFDAGDADLFTDTFTLAMKSGQKIVAKYSMGPFGIWLVQETAKGETTSTVGLLTLGTELEFKTQHLGVSFALGANTTLAATTTKYQVEGEDAATQTALGLVHNLSKTTAVKVVTATLKNEDGVGSAGRTLSSGGIALANPGKDASSPGTGETVTGTQVQLSMSF